MLHVDEIIGAIGIDGRSAPTGGQRAAGSTGEMPTASQGRGPQRGILDREPNHRRIAR